MKRGFSPAGVALYSVVLLVLSVGGVAIGWFVADSELKAQNTALPTPSRSAGGKSPAPTLKTSPTEAAPSPSPTPEPDKPTVPEILGVDFQQARNKIMGMNTGAQVVLKFDEGSQETPGKVLSVDPNVNEPIERGRVIKLTIAGKAPEIQNGVPRVATFTCEEARKILLGAGLLIGEYPSGETGIAEKSDPSWGAPVHWNDRVKLYCVKPGESPSPAAP